MTDRYDAIVIGAGHNGLVCAAVLARAGKKVLVLEAADDVGGAARTRRFADGFSVSACAHLLYQLQPQVASDLDLDVPLAADGLSTVVLAHDGRHVRLNGPRAENVSDTDQAAFRDFHRRMTRFADLLQKYLNRTPPRLANGTRRDLMTLGELGFDLRRLGRDDMREFLRLIGMNIYDEVEERFESPLLKGAISLDAVLGTHLGPRSPNTILTYLYRLCGGHGRLALPAGGMGAVAEALAQCARSHGVTIRTGMPVRRIVVDNGRAAGVETENGETFASWTIVSNADPKRTILDLVGSRHVETGFTRRIANLRARGNAAKLHLALDGLPAIDGLEKKELGDRLLIAPDADYVERSFNPAKYGEISAEPVLEITIPSFRDASLAPTGKHVLSAVVQYAPYRLKEGWSDAARAALRDRAIDTIAAYAPDLPGRIVDAELLSPADIENEFGMSGGHWHHAELTLDQFLFVRPVPGAAQYRMPLEGLWLCGAGTHPGGGISGACGRNAARMILKQQKPA